MTTLSWCCKSTHSVSLCDKNGISKTYFAHLPFTLSKNWSTFSFIWNINYFRCNIFKLNHHSTHSCGQNTLGLTYILWPRAIHQVQSSHCNHTASHTAKQTPDWWCTNLTQFALLAILHCPISPRKLLCLIHLGVNNNLWNLLQIISHIRPSICLSVFSCLFSSTLILS